MGRLIEGYWTCKYCGTKDIRGSVQKCPHCGKTRGPEVKFYMKDTKSAEDQDRREQDWLCSYCDSLNPADVDVCPNCGATREDSEKNYFELHPEREQVLSGEQASREEEPQPEKPVQQAPPPARKNNFWIFALATVAIFALLFFMFRPKIREAEITRMGWERSIDVEQLVTVRESGWTLPRDGRLQYTQEEIQTYNTVLDHYETVTKYREVPDGGHEEVVGYKDLGNGNFEEITTWVTDYRTETYQEQEPVYIQVPVYGTKYYYDVDRWKVVRTLDSSGMDKSPYWADGTRGPDERLGAEHERYYIYVNYKDREYSCPVPFAVWDALNIGDAVEGEINGSYFELIE